MRSKTQSILTRRYRDGGTGRFPDSLIVEEPLVIRLDETDVSTTMRTPGHDFELAAGFCHAEGILAGEEIAGIRYCRPSSTDPDGVVTSERVSGAEGEFNTVTVETGGRAPVPTPRLGTTTSSCGICGADAIGELTERLRQLPAGEPWPLELLVELPARVEEAQELFRTTGAVHGAAAFDRSGQLLVSREDIGRHNAVDKVVGRLLLDGRLPATEMVLVVSGRASFEIVQKAWAAGFTALVAVSAPSSLAVATARRAGMTLVGFTRTDAEGVTAANIYSPEG